MADDGLSGRRLGPAPGAEVSAPGERDAEARRNRDRYPEAAALIDKIRAAFPGAKVVYFGPRRGSGGAPD